MRVIRHWLLVAALVSGCGTTPYNRYLQEHPDWKPDFPEMGVDLEETVASIHTPPPRGVKNKLMAQHQLEIYQTNSDPWRRVAMRRIVGMEAPEDYLIIVHSSCDFGSPGYFWSYSSASWYYLAQGGLTAYGHWKLVESCRGYLVREGVDDVPLPVRHKLERAGFLSSTLPSE